MLPGERFFQLVLDLLFTDEGYLRLWVWYKRRKLMNDLIKYVRDSYYEHPF